MKDEAAEKHLGVTPSVELKQKDCEDKIRCYKEAVDILKEMEFEDQFYEVI
jgi:hypothetical protein